MDSIIPCSRSAKPESRLNLNNPKNKKKPDRETLQTFLNPRNECFETHVATCPQLSQHLNLNLTLQPQILEPMSNPF